MLTIDADNEVRLTDTSSGSTLAEVRHGGSAQPTSLALAPDGQNLAVGFDDGAIVVRNTTTGSEVRGESQMAMNRRAKMTITARSFDRARRSA